MIRALPAPLAMPWRPVAFGLVLVAWVAVNGWLLWEMRLARAGDWETFRHGVNNPELVDTYIFPPLTTLVWRALILPVGFYGFVLLHLASVPLMRDRLLILLTLGSAPFWLDTVLGNVNVF